MKRLKHNIYMGNHWKFFLFFILGGFLLMGCTDDVLSEEPEKPEDNELTELTLNIPLTLGNTTHTRGTTKPDGSSTDGEIPGFTNENIMEEYYLFFCAWNEETQSYEYKFNIHSKERVDFNNIKDVTKDHVIIPVRISAEDLLELADNDKVKIFIVGNISEDLLKYFGTADPGYKSKLKSHDEEIDFVNNFDPDAYFWNVQTSWNIISRFPGVGGYSLPLINGHDCEVTGFKDIHKEDLQKIISKKGTEEKTFEEIQADIQGILNKIFYSKTLDLERINGRIDIADGSPEGKGLYSLFPNDPECPIYLRMTRITPINISKFSYIFRHSAKGDENGIFYDGNTEEGFDIALFGDERGDNDEYYNWVVDADLDYKYFWEDDGKDGSQTDQSNFTLADHYYDYLKKGDVQTCAPEGWMNLSYTMMEARFIDSQKALYSDFLYDNKNFSYEAENASGEKIRYYPWRYVPENTLPTRLGLRMTLTPGIRFSFVLWDVEQNKYLTAGRAEELTKQWGENSKYKFRVDLTGERPKLFLIVEGEEYQALNDGFWEGYMFHYCYYIRHNYNPKKPDAITPMKYGVVRNNVYRIRVTGLNGTPRPYIPKDPVDPVDSYDIAVETQILPWSVRKDEGLILK